MESTRRSRALLPGRLAVALVAALVALVLVCGLTLQAMAARVEASRWVEHTRVVEDHLDHLQSRMKDAVMGERAFLLSGREDFIGRVDVGEIAVQGYLVTLRRLTGDNATQQRRLETLTPFITERFAMMQENIRWQRAGDPGGRDPERTVRGTVLMDEVRAGIAAMLEEEQRLLATRNARYDDAVTWSTYVTLGGAAILFAMILIFAVTTSRDFRAREAEAWLRRVQMAIGETVVGDQPVDTLGEGVLRALVGHLDAAVGAIYLADADGVLRRVAAHALPASDDRVVLRPGDGVAGQALAQDRVIHLRELPDGYLPITSAAGRGAPRQLVIAPASVDGVVQAVTELGFLHAVAPAELEALERVASVIAVAVRSANDRRRLQALLEETQRQGEELEVQQEELRVSNEELEERGRTLQVSQSRLENQQAELEEINAQLEEQAHSLVQQRDALARTGVELQRSSTYKSEFLANMSHELRTPLNSSLILAKLLADNRERNLTPEQIKFAETIYSAGNDLLTLINDILDLSKIEAGKVDVRPESITLARVLDDLARTFQPVAADKRLALAATATADAPTTIETDPTRLLQILKNLLSNALKFTEQGGVTLAVRLDPLGIAFEIRDTGIGIAADQHEVVFEAFRQADGTTNRRYGGTGLGLSISRDLARLLGGDLTLASAPGRGSTFTLRLPLCFVPRDGAAAPTRQLPPPPRRHPERAATIPSDAVPPGARSLLIIDDDPAFTEILVALARELEFHPLTAATAADGLALALRCRPSAIVLDIGLPDRSGLSVLDTLKHQAVTRHIPVHIISSADHMQSALEMGAAGYALKPVERDRLVAAFHELEGKLTQRVRRVLVVEDDPVLRDSTSRLLAGAEVEITQAGTSAEALALLAAQTFDCMVLDLSLPDRSGLELLEEMSRHERYGFPPVIVYTGRALSHDEEQNLRRFSQSIIIKGARSPERLLDEVTLFLHQVEAELPDDRQRMLRDARDREAVFEGRRILIVEDDVRNIFALSSVLEPKGAKIEIARNGREALEVLARQPAIDLVLMDIMMPEMDGLEATRAIRAQPALARLPIIALTAKAMIDDRDHCLAAGANDYIAKPLDVDKLLSLARVWIRK